MMRSALVEAPGRMRGSHTIQTGWRRHSAIDLPARLVNHSCGANVGIRDNEEGAYDFFALRLIRAGEEVTWDYACSEYEVVGFDVCLCGHADCRGKVGGFAEHGELVREKYGESFIADYLK